MHFRASALTDCQPVTKHRPDGRGYVGAHGQRPSRVPVDRPDHRPDGNSRRANTDRHRLGDAEL